MRCKGISHKVERKRYDNPLKEIDDLAGVRVICLFESDLNRIQQEVHDLFAIIKSEDKTDDLGLDRMGYHGHHCVVSLSSAFLGPRYDDLRHLRCEIQIRTVLQDSWAQLSHNLVYKSENAIPPNVHRQLNNVSSLLEIAQHVFDDIRQTRNVYVREVEEKKKNVDDFLSQQTDNETISAYPTWKYPDLQPNPKIQELLIRNLDHSRFKTLLDIDLAVSAASDAVQAYRQENPSWFASGTDFITKSLGFLTSIFKISILSLPKHVKPSEDTPIR